ncbi:MAG: galactokinase [Gemmatimonadetes bacterium]|nr:galactokinase [Gemmatimonadota bacterium]
MPDATLPEIVAHRFADLYDGAPGVLVRAPGRVNLIGEHTDYNDGFVLPLAIERAVWIALRPRDDGAVRLYSLHHQEAREFALGGREREGRAWIEYVKGTAWALGEAGHALRGWEGVVGSDVPIGAGLSSSAALELATARAFAAVSGVDWDPAAMALVCQRAENEWVGMKCGIMDPMISAVGRAGHAVLIDCRTLATGAVPLPPGTRVVVMDTSTRRGLVDSAYNERRRQCEAVAAAFGVPALRDLSAAELEAGAARLDPLLARRARHVVTENERTLAAADAMRAGEAALLGRLMNAGHRSLRDYYEVSSPELDAMVEIAQARPECHGARMTGAGFGGCAVALVDKGDSAEFVERVSARYQEATGKEPRLHVTGATGGAEIVPVPG